MKLESQATTEMTLANSVQLAVIDTRLKDYQQIIAALSPTMTIVLIDSASDGLAEIAATLAQYPAVTALHLFSHASPASLQLGSSYLNSSTITTATSLAMLKTIGSSLVKDGMILVYGCDLADGSSGQNFVSQFASATGVTVGASSNTTGAIALGGDWQMEVFASPNGQFLATHAGIQNATHAVALSLSDYQQSLAGIITASNEEAIATGNDYIHTTPGTTQLAMLGAVELDNGSRVVLQANNKADYYGMANLDYLSVVIVDTLGNTSTIALTGTVATVVNNNGGTNNNSNSIQTNDAASIVALRNGGFVVSSYSNDGYGIQMYNNAGVSQSITAPIGFTSSVNPSAKVLASNDGGFVLLWTVLDTNTNAVSLEFQRYTSAGAISGARYSEAFASTSPVVQNAAIDMHGNIAVPISSNDVYTPSQVKLWNASDVAVGIYNTAYYQSAAVIAPMYGGGFDLFGNDIVAGVGNTASSYYVQTLGADGSLGLTVASTIPVANLRAVELSLSGDYLAVGGSTDTAKLGYFVDGFNPSAGTTTQSIADADKVASIPSLSEDGNITSAWITGSVTNANGLVTSGAVSVVTYGSAFTIPVDYPPTIAGTFTTSGALTDKTNILPFANLTVSDVDSVTGKVTITYNAANGSLSGTGLSGTAGNYVLELSTTSLTTLNTELRALVFTPTENQIVPNSTVQTTFTLTPGDGVRDGRANTATNAIATSINDAPSINNNSSAASATANAAENQTAVMTFTTADPDVGQTITYSKSGADAALFNIHPTTGVLTFITAPNFESPSDAGGNNVYDVTITASDGLASDSQAIAVTVTNVNEHPVITSNGGGSSGSTSAAENQLAVTTVTANDVDAATTLTYSVSGTDAALFDINASNGTLTFKTTPNFETPADNGGNNIYDVIVTASDGSLTDTQTLAITVTNVNDAPTIVGLSAADNQSVLASASAILIDLASVATVTDEDNANFNGGSLTVAFGSGRQVGDSVAIRTGSGVTLSNNMAVASSITIGGQVIGSIATGGTGAGSDNLIINFNAQATPARISTLLQNITFDATDIKADRVLNIQVNDGAANSNTASLTISVTTNPSVAISTNAGPLKAGDTALIQFQFSEAPVGFTDSDISVSGGTISDLMVDGVDDTLYTALFTPTADTQSLSGSVSIGAGTFTNADTEVNLASTPNAALTGDTLPPSVTSIVRAASDPTNATSVSFTVTFAESVTGVGTSDFSLTTNGGAAGNIASVSGSGTTYTVTVNSLTGEGTLRLDLNGSLTGIVDSLTNPIAGGFSGGQSYSFDRTAPAVNTITRAQSDNTNASILTFDVVFSENISNVDIGDFALNRTGSANGTISAISGSGSTYTVTVSGVTGVGTLGLDLNSAGTGIIDSASNAITAGFTAGQTYTVDRVTPSVSSIVPAGSASTNGTSSSYTVTFSENVSGVDISDFTITSTNSATANVASISGSGNVYTIVVDNIDGDGTLRLDLQSSGTGIIDTFGNPISAGFTSGSVITVDRIAPTLALPIAISDNALIIDETSTITFTFSEPITGLTTDDINVENGMIDGLASSNGGLTWTGTLTPSSNITDVNNTITLTLSGVTDLAGNSGSGTTTSPNYQIDTTRPILASAITISDTALKIGDTALVTFNFSEAVANFTTTDVLSPNGILSNLVTTDSGLTWTATLTPNTTTDYLNNLTLDYSGITDLAGNAGSGTATSSNYVVDTDRPVLASAITISDTALKIGDTALVSFVFSEAVNNFTTTDVNVDNATLSNLISADGGITWTANLNASANTTDSINSLTLNLSALTDLAGNAGSGNSSGPNYSIDTTRPGVSGNMSFSDAALRIGETSTMTINFTEAVVNLDASDFNFSSGSLSNFVSSNGG
ncbi:Ig-like domain-containing protein, partial [Undibacterium amnicola]